MVAGFELRKRRKTTTSDSTDSPAPMRRISGTRRTVGKQAEEENRGGVERGPEQCEDAERDVVAVGEVDEFHHPENQRDAERAEGIETAKAQSVEE